MVSSTLKQPPPTQDISLFVYTHLDIQPNTNPGAALRPQTAGLKELTRVDLMEFGEPLERTGLFLERGVKREGFDDGGSRCWLRGWGGLCSKTAGHF